MASECSAPDPVFAVLDGSDDDAAVVAAAHSLAALRGAHVDGVFVGRDPAAALLMGGDGFTGGVGVTALDALESEREAAVGRARSVAELGGAAFRVFQGPRAQAASLARLSAFAVMGAGAVRNGGDLADVAGEMLIDGGVAVLVARSTPPFATLGLAWDGSREAARSMRSARDVVAQAERVVVMQGAGDLHRRDGALSDPSHAETWLKRRNVAVTHRVLHHRPVGEALLEACLQEGVDLLIAGAYGQPRLREAVFGGVTRTLLESDGPSLFLAH